MSNLSFPDRRSKNDRRAKPTSPLTTSSLFGLRTNSRRVQDKKKHRYVDRYSRRSVSLIIVTILLSIADANFTLKLVSTGAQEINPVMDFFLNFGPIPFLIAKYLLTGTSLIMFLVHKNFTIWGGWLKVKNLLIFVLVMYVILIIYELILLLMIKP